MWVRKPLADETKQSYTLPAKVKNTVQPHLMSEGSVDIAMMKEEASVGRAIGFVYAMDTDRAQRPVKYSIDLGTDMNRRFDLDEAGGTLTVAKSLDREVVAWHNISVIATEASDNPPDSSHAALHIRIQDIDGNPPRHGNTAGILTRQANFDRLLQNVPAVITDGEIPMQWPISKTEIDTGAKYSWTQYLMLNSEFTQKMLRAVLQSSKDGVSIESLQSDFQLLCGESIPHRKLGYPKLEDYLRSIPSVVRMSFFQGQLWCFAGVCEQTAHVAELVARQKSTKKSGRSQMVNCRMRFKSSDPYMLLNWRQRSSLRQPSAYTATSFSNQFRSRGGFRGFSAAGDFRQMDRRFSSVTPVQHRPPAVQPNAVAKAKPPAPSQPSKQPQTGLYDVELMKRRISAILKRYCCGLWLSKLPDVYKQMFQQTLHPQVLIDLKAWTDDCMVEQTLSSNCLLYPPRTAKSSAPNTNGSAQSSQSSSSPLTASPSPLQTSEHLPLPTLIPPQPPRPTKPQISSGNSPVNNPQTQPIVPNATSIPLLVSLHKCGPDLEPVQNLNGAPHGSTHGHSSPVVSAEVCTRLKELLSKYSRGLWVHALPKLFSDTYKTPFPTEILDNISLLLEICSVEYPNPNDKSKAILYNANKESRKALDAEGGRNSNPPLPSGVQVLSCMIPDSLTLPLEQFSSVLVTDSMNGHTVTVRYIGAKYSGEQEVMEESMRAFYRRTSIRRSQPKLAVGQLVAVQGEDEEELARAQVTEIMSEANKVKIYYVDYGFFAETDATCLLEIHPNFCTLPFQATHVQLAGLEAFTSHPLVLSTLDKLAVGNILLMEVLETSQRNSVPQVVLYDTSQDDDVNINSMCLKALQEESMNNPLIVDSISQQVSVTNVCADGTVYCQVPSRGTARLEKLIGQTEAFFRAQTTSESLVSRPFAGKLCLARCRGEWSRVEIKNLYGNRVMEVFYVDLGLSSTIEVTDLREFPPPFVEELTVIPPQAIKCRLASLNIPTSNWSFEMVSFLKEAIVGVPDCKMKIEKCQEKLVHMYLFIGADSQELSMSINYRLAHSEMWRQLVSKSERHISDSGSHAVDDSKDAAPNTSMEPSMPLTLEFPQPGQNMDVFVPMACHPGHFVLQPWKDMHKLVVLMGEMMLYYNRPQESTACLEVKKGELYAAKIDKTWRRAVVKGTIANGLVSVYELDYGKHEIVRSSSIRPLIEEFRQLPFQAVTAQLAGVKQQTWSEAASMLFRSHVEKKALVAQVESVQDLSEVKGEPWARKLTVFLVDTAVEDQDLWIHSIIHSIDSELTSAA
ncbi:tudor domain-containing protein 7A [Neosynchiropus ocellatus]